MLSNIFLAALALLPCLTIARSLRGAEGELSLTARNMAFRSLADVEWDVDPVVDYPMILETNQIGFKYNYTGSLSVYKYLKFGLYNKYCNESISDESISIPVDGFDMVVAPNDIGSNGEPAYYFPLAIDQTIIADSDYYQLAADGLDATIQFCVRRDYMFVGDSSESINYHKTFVKISVDLKNGFQLENIDTVRTVPTLDKKEAELGCEVTPFYCDKTTFAKVNPPSAYVLGDVLAFCVEVSAADQARCHIIDVVEAHLYQSNMAPVIDQHTDLVTDAAQEGLTSKECNPAIRVCRVETRLTSKFFEKLAPNPLDITGIVRLGLGP
jgi:hypothetical protein